MEGSANPHICIKEWKDIAGLESELASCVML